jgi:tRNA pseudouridine38-40 synthase
MKKIRALVAYDGKDFLGWQKVKDARSVQGALETVLTTLTQEFIKVEGASRTDKGVHAKGQVVSFSLSDLRYPLRDLKRRLNCLIPKDIRIVKLEESEEAFHPTLSCLSKEYVYRIVHNGGFLPQDRFYSWQLECLLDILKMQAGALKMMEYQNFRSFENRRKSEPRENPNCKLSKFLITPLKNELLITIQGDRFLYKMVRNLVGTLVAIGKGEISLESLDLIFDKEDRVEAGVAAPACGLSLNSVHYPKKIKVFAS